MPELKEKMLIAETGGVSYIYAVLTYYGIGLHPLYHQPEATSRPCCLRHLANSQNPAVDRSDSLVGRCQVSSKAQVGHVEL